MRLSPSSCAGPKPPLLYLCVSFERHRDDYYDRLAAVSRSGARTEWVVFFLDGVAHQAAMKSLRKLEGLRIVREITDRQRNQVVVAEEILKIVSETRGTDDDRMILSAR